MLIKNKTILVTGGTGSFGRSFIKFLIKNHNPKNIIVYKQFWYNDVIYGNKIQAQVERFKVRVFDRIFFTITKIFSTKEKN